MLYISLGNIDYNQIIDAVSKYNNFEIRLDLLELSNQEIKNIFSIANKNFILTARGELDSKLIEKMQIALEGRVQYCDIELSQTKNIEIYEKILNLCKFNDCKIIYSYHNFDKTPSFIELSDIYYQMKELKVLKESNRCLYKIVCQANTKKDTMNILNLYNIADDIIAFSMGEAFKYSRLIAHHLGSPITYTYLGNLPTANGQFEHNKMKAILELIDE